MLQLILGVAGTGKTTHMLQTLKEKAKEGERCIWLVPEQFSSSAETMVYNALKDKLSGRVEVVSFRTLAERILKACGGFALPIITDAGRVVFVRRAMDSLQDEIKTFARHRRNTAFCNMCADTISELKIAGVSAKLLGTIGRQEQDPKLQEMAIVFQAYEALIDGVAADPEDRLTYASKQDACAYFTNKICFIDNFDGFTAPEYAIIAQILQGCSQLYVGLCTNSYTEIDEGLGLFSPVRRTASRLFECAQKEGIQTKIPLVMEKQHRSNEQGLKAVHCVFEQPQKEGVKYETQGVFLTKATDEWQEIRLVAAEMRRLALQGVPYSRMALVCRDVESYKSVVRRELEAFEIPYFEDAPSTVEYTSAVAFIRKALEILRFGIATRPILGMLKSGLCGYTESEIYALENYLYTWERADWRQSFENNPLGLLANLDKEAEQQLATAERLRQAIVPVLQQFTKACRNQPVGVVSKQLYMLLNNFNAVENAEKAALVLEQAGETVLAETERRAWDVAMDLLDQMFLLVGEEVLAPAEYDDLFLLLVRSTDFGQIPQSLECTVFTSADRMRLADPDYCFVVGVCEGEFPMQVGYSGILTHTDREKLVEKGVEMPGSFQNRILLEEMFFYRALTSSRKGLYISWPARRGGVAKSISSSLEPVCAMQPPTLQLETIQLAATPKAAFDLLCETYRENTPEVATLQAALQKNNSEWTENALEMVEQVDNTGVFRVRDIEALRNATGSNITLSATRAERYYECRFSYYMERILRVRPRRKGELSPLESGTFIHYVLEHALKDAGSDFAVCSDLQLAELGAKHADVFITENFPENTRRSEYLLDEMKSSVARLLCFMRDAAAQSDFSVDALELSLADVEDGVMPLMVETPDGQTIRVTGQIDRVDVLEKDGKTYLCIIDYKTGAKEFNLEDLYCGLNMQMMIYMATLCKNAADKYPDAVPAGVLYLTSDPAPASGSRQDGETLVYKMDGLLLQDTQIVGAMDKSKSGVFLPVKYNKDGSLRKSKQLADYEKMGRIMKHVEKRLVEMSEGVYTGNFDAVPLVKTSRKPCTYCPYRAACRHEDGKNETSIAAPANVFEETEIAQPEEGGGTNE